jgi:hypothetical protein
VSKPVNYFRLRVLAAVLITLSGIGQVALLWFRELTGANLLGAFVGVVYIIIGIGLQGQSRFTLYVAVVVPIAAAVLLLDTSPSAPLDTLRIFRLAMDLLVVLCSALVLTHTRA